MPHVELDKKATYLTLIMSTRIKICMFPAAYAAYHDTLLQLKEISEQFPSWDAMLAEEKDPNLSSSRACTVCATAPERRLLSTWLVAATGTPPTAEGSNDSGADEAGCRRWTAFLAFWISLRLAGLIARSGTANRDFWIETYREAESYEADFLPRAWAILGEEQKMRLHARVMHLLTACNVALSFRSRQAHARSLFPGTSPAKDDTHEAACQVICNAAMRAAQGVAREYLRITWDVLDPKQMPKAVNARLKTLFSLQYPLRPRTGSPETTATSNAGASGAATVVHTSCMGNLVETLQRTHQQQHKADHTCHVWMRMVRTALLQIGYNLVVKANAGMIDYCYFLLPALVDFETCLTLCESVGRGHASAAAARLTVPDDAEEQETRDQAHRTLTALLKTTQDAYATAIDRILDGYRQSSVSDLTPPHQLTAITLDAPTNPLTSPSSPYTLKGNATTTAVAAHSFSGLLFTSTRNGSGAAGRQELVLSKTAYELLVKVVEPTCNILQRYSVYVKHNERESLTHTAAEHRSCDSLENETYHDTKISGGNGGTSCGGGPGAKNGVSSPSMITVNSPAARKQFVDFLKKKLNSCFTEALVATKSKAVSAKAREQASMDTYLVTAYLSAAALR